ncbi:MAG: O-antigen ligase family protein [Patescibacteria group bacterium]
MQKLSKQLEGALKYLTAGILLAVPLYPKFPFLRIPGTYVSVRLEDFLMLLTFGVWFAYILPNIKSLLKNKLFWAVSLFWVIGLVATLSGIFLTKTVDPHIGLLHWARRVQYVLPLFIGMATMKMVDGKKNLNFFVKTIMIVIFFAFLYGVGQKHFSLPIITTQNEEYAKGRALYYTLSGHLVSTFAGHYDLASYLILVTPMFVSILLSDKAIEELGLSKSKAKSRAILGMTIGQSLWLIIFTASRISIVSYIVAICIPLFLIKKYWAIPIVFISVFVLTLISGNLLTRYQQILDIVVDKITYTVDQAITVHAAGFVLAAEDRSTSIRLNVEWPRAIRALTKNPLLGTGYSSITLATDNDYLRFLGETGILGFLAFFLVFFKSGIEFLKYTIENYSKESNLKSIFVYGMVGATVGILINAVFIDVFEASKLAIMFWLMMGLAIGLTRYEQTK